MVIVDRCIYLRVSGSSYIFLVLYVDDTIVDGVLLRRSQRVRRPAILDDYIIYL